MMKEVPCACRSTACRVLHRHAYGNRDECSSTPPTAGGRWGCCDRHLGGPAADRLPAEGWISAESWIEDPASAVRARDVGVADGLPAGIAPGAADVPTAGLGAAAMVIASAADPGGLRGRRLAGSDR